ncbi:D-glycero-alpha-D-manno-heptose-1,7-bisphosphate 7-phosphatase [Bradyrhizobium diazoefficiens]|uniref:D-glycero-alpha-D-manno-heptose-1,7-bisphosphate 7-phosphatase n=1 Tax=Bradyrhizobium diazoefficiens TaxID=1355477 RepID=UPI00272BC0C3|nr:HAD-IIIA family hydrolase [Bradyrhizobium diazoefficiens]WLA68038.1 HAD-IIIA family hydrolase [Bradyrhizobium diazoefficiens]
MTTRAIFLDRDGVLNHPVIRGGKSYPPARVEELKIYDGLRDQLQRLKNRGFALIVVTNQPDVARGTTPKSTVEGINAAIAREIPAIDRFVVCYHDNADGCDCRKPKPGMLLAGAVEFDVDLPRSYMIGDRKGDVDAGRAAGSRTIFVDRGYSEAAPTNYDYKVSSTSEALQIIESESDHEKS